MSVTKEKKVPGTVGGCTSFVSKFHLDPLSYHGSQCQAGSTWLFTLRGPWEIGLAGASRYGLEPNFLWLISLATIPATVLISPQALCFLSLCLFFSLSCSLHGTVRPHVQKANNGRHSFCVRQERLHIIQVHNHVNYTSVLGSSDMLNANLLTLTEH